MSNSGSHMTAAVLRSVPAQGFAVEQVPVPALRADSQKVLIKVLACGVCGTDRHILSGESYRPDMPFVLGHETVGVVADAPLAHRHWRGRRVAISPFRPCDRCPACEAEQPRFCREDRTVNGINGAWGGFADYLTADVRQLVAVPDALPSEHAAALVDSGATAYNAISRLPDSTRSVLLVGGGAVGRQIAMLLQTRGLEVTVLEPVPARRQLIDRLFAGAVTAIDSPDQAPAEVDAVVECSGAARVIGWAIDRLRAHGVLILIGYATTNVDFAGVARKELTILGIRSGSRDQLAAVLETAGASTAPTDPEPTRWPLSRINDAFADLASDDPPAKVVIVPD